MIFSKGAPKSNVVLKDNIIYENVHELKMICRYDGINYYGGLLVWIKNCIKN